MVVTEKRRDAAVKERIMAQPKSMLSRKPLIVNAGTVVSTDRLSSMRMIMIMIGRIPRSSSQGRIPAIREAAMTSTVDAERAGGPNAKEVTEMQRSPRSFTAPGHLCRGLLPGLYA
jgi:hypothetical protein